MFRRGEGPKNDKCSLRRISIKEKMRIYLREVSDIGSKTMLQRLQCAQNGETVKHGSGEMVKCQNSEMV